MEKISHVFKNDGAILVTRPSKPLDLLKAHSFQEKGENPATFIKFAGTQGELLEGELVLEYVVLKGRSFSVDDLHTILQKIDAQA